MGVLKSYLLALIVCFNGLVGHAGTLDLSGEGGTDWKAGEILDEAFVKKQGIDCFFRVEEISDAIFQRMWLKSWKKNCTLKRSDLRYLRVLHRNATGQAQVGEMVVNRIIAEKVLKIFRQLYESGYRIEGMVLIDDYGADDEMSMRANNTSCFNFRFMTNSKKRVSKHGLGLAIDINSRYNPYVKRKSDGGYSVQPTTGRPYAFNRDKRTDIPYKIDRNDLAYKLFKAAGFSWGGEWRRVKDYQHFEYKQE